MSTGKPIRHIDHYFDGLVQINAVPTDGRFQDSLDYKDMVSRRKKLKAFCEYCIRQPKQPSYFIKGIGSVVTKPDVKLSDVYCPDCGYALIWSRKYSLQ